MFSLSSVNHKFSIIIIAFVIQISFLQANSKSCREISLKSKFLNEERKVFIHLPASYDDSNKEYITLYRLDGREDFDYSVPLIDYLSRWKEIPELIIVSIPHKNRFSDLSFNKDPYVEHECNAPKFTSFIMEELAPYVDNKFRTNGEKAIFGHSLGSMFVLNNYFNNNGFFNYYIAAGPNFARETFLLPQIKEILESSNDFKGKVFISKEPYVSTKDRSEYEKFIALLDNNSNLVYSQEYMGNDSHISMAPKSLISGLRWLFKR